MWCGNNGRRLWIAAALFLFGLLTLSCRSKDEDEPPTGPNNLVPPMLFVFTAPSGSMFCFPTGSVTPAYEADLGIGAVCAAMTNRLGDLLFALDAESNTLRVLSLPTLHILHTIMIGGNPLDLDLNPSASIAYIVTRNANFWRFSVSGETSDTLETGLYPRRFALRPAGRSEAWVACPGDNTIRILDLGLFRAGDTIRTDDPPTDVAFSPDGSIAYVAVGGLTRAILSFHTSDRREFQRREAGPGPLDLAISSDGQFLCAADSTMGRVQVWATDRLPVIAQLDSIPEAGHPLFSSRARTLFVNSPARACVFSIHVSDSGAVFADTFAVEEIPRTIALWESFP